MSARPARFRRAFAFLRVPSRPSLLASLSLLAAAAACASAGGGRAGSSAAAHADIVDVNGAAMGTATFRMAGNALQVDVSVRGLSRGAHGIHLHAVGKCEPPSFASAGAHVNPAGAMHGVKNPAGPHAGDLPNVIGGGTTKYTAKTLRMRLEGTAASLFDADGTAIVIHADPDDEETDPTGKSGARIGCGVVVRG